ncbi:MAG: hypothetical protein ACTSVX_05760 [Promethearchaeota archaeon]
MLFQFDIVENFLRPLGQMGGFLILILGIIWIIFAIYEARRRGSFKERKVEEWDFDITKFLKFLTYLGFLVGILSLLAGISELMLNIPPSVAYATNTQPKVSIFTAAFLIILGLITFLKPINDLPIASVIGLLAASLVVIIIIVALPEKVIEIIGIFINPKLFLTILFIVVFAISALTVKFYIGGLMSISKAISWPPLATIIALFCFLQGFLIVVVGVSITGLL